MYISSMWDLVKSMNFKTYLLLCGLLDYEKTNPFSLNKNVKTWI